MEFEGVGSALYWLDLYDHFFLTGHWVNFLDVNVSSSAAVKCQRDRVVVGIGHDDACKKLSTVNGP